MAAPSLGSVLVPGTSKDASSSNEKPSSSSSLPTEFRLLLQILDRVSQQSQLLQRVADQQTTAASQLSSLSKQTRALEDSFQHQFAGNLHACRTELGEMRERNEKLFKGLGQDSDEGFNPLVRGKKSVFAGLKEKLPKRSRTEVDNQMLHRRLSLDSITGSHQPVYISQNTLGFDSESVVESSRSRCRGLIRSAWFEATCAVVICANTVTIGITFQHSIAAALDPDHATSSLMDSLLSVMTICFLGFYSIEAGFKVVAFGASYFCGPDWHWNIFDSILVGTAWFEIISSLVGMDSGGGVTFLRVLRLLKMMKMLRVVRVMRFFRELRMMLTSIIGSITTLLWSMLMLSLITFVFGLMFLHAVTDYLNETPAEEIPEETMFLIQEYWCSVFQATVTLYMAVTGGSDWEPLAKPIRSSGSMYFLLFLFYIAFSMVAVLNVLTGLFVDTALQVAEGDEQAVAEELTEDDKPFIIKFREHLESLSPGESGGKTFLFEDLSKSYSMPVVRTFCKTLSLDMEAMKKVFKMLNEHSSGGGGVQIDEFIRASAKFKGDHQAIEQISLHFDVKKHAAQMLAFMEHSDERFEEFHSFFEALGAPESDVIPLSERLQRAHVLPNNWAGRHHWLDHGVVS